MKNIQVISEHPAIMRRSLLVWATGAAAALIGTILAVPLIGYVVSPVLVRRQGTWSEVGRVGDLQPGQPAELEFASTAKDGWYQTSSKKAVWGVKEPDGRLIIFSPICPHLGCGFRWDTGEQRFKCPCHGSVFDITGRVVAGPAPRPLDVLPAKVDQGKIYVMYKQFKSGLSRPVEL
jgi:menaquinol-cytochrome c reductase iron-sulfur subunit